MDFFAIVMVTDLLLSARTSYYECMPRCGSDTLPLKDVFGKWLVPDVRSTIHNFTSILLEIQQTGTCSFLPRFSDEFTRTSQGVLLEKGNTGQSDLLLYV